MKTASYQIKDHLLEPARFLPSPNCDVRPEGVAIDLLVIHNISLPAGHFGGPYIQQLFQNELDCSADPSFQALSSLCVSAHLLIDRSGAVTQFVPFDKRAWHAGQSSFCGREACNDFSIGIELEGCDDQPFEQTQYDALALVTRLLLANYSCLNRDSIVGHSDIAPTRKTDPGPCFDWGRFHQLLD